MAETCGFRWREREGDNCGPTVWRTCILRKGHTEPVDHHAIKDGARRFLTIQVEILNPGDLLLMDADDPDTIARLLTVNRVDEERRNLVLDRLGERFSITLPKHAAVLVET